MGYIYLYTGTGAGKTTNALGLALRSLGHGHKVVIIQFMKGRKDIGEVLIKEKLGELKDLYEIYQFGREGFVDLKNPSEEDKKLAREGLEFARKKLREKPHLLVLDEINLACAIGLVPTEEVLSLLKEVPEETDVVLTGRYADFRLAEAADFVNEVLPTKMPEKIVTKKGINY